MSENNKRDWGRVVIGTRLEKMTDSHFFEVWTQLVYSHCAEGYLTIRGKPPHQSANSLVRNFLKIPREKADSLLFIDSDAILTPGDVTALRNLEEGKAYDILQAFYVRRGWPPDAVWFKAGTDGTMFNSMILEEQTGDVDAIGLHCCLIRREVFERMLGDADPKEYEWFYYPPRDNGGEDVEFAQNAQKAGFRLGATTAVKTGHLSTITTGWETYQDYLNMSGTRARTLQFVELAKMVAEYLGENPDPVMMKAVQAEIVNQEWSANPPKNAIECRDFYGSAANGAYFYDLLRWNTSETYWNITAGLKQYHDENALVIGGGIGGEVDILIKNNQVDVYELPGRLREFLVWRFGGSARILAGNSFADAYPIGMYGLIVMIDTLEHVHPDEVDLFLECVNEVLEPGGVLYCHNTFKQPGFPMHFDHTEVFNAWVKDNGYIAIDPYTWRKPL